MSRSRTAAKLRPMAERAMFRPSSAKTHQQHRHQQVELLVGAEGVGAPGQVDPEQHRVRGRATDPDAPGDGVPLVPDVGAQEDQAQGDDGQVQPAQPAGQRRHDQAHRGRGQTAGEQPDRQERDAEAVELVVVGVTGHHGGGVGADAQEERVPQADLPGVPGDQVEPDGPDRQHRPGGQQPQQVVLEHEGQQQGHHRQHEDGDLLRPGVEQGHVLAVGGVEHRAAQRTSAAGRCGLLGPGGRLVLHGGHTRSTSRVPNSP